MSLAVSSSSAPSRLSVWLTTRMSTWAEPPARLHDPRGRLGILEVGVDVRDRAADLLELGEHRLQPTGIRRSSSAAHE